MRTSTGNGGIRSICCDCCTYSNGFAYITSGQVWKDMVHEDKSSAMFDHCGFNSKLNISISVLQSGYDGRSVLLTAGRRIRTLHTRILMPRDYGEVVEWKNFMPHHSSQKRRM